MKVVVTPFAAPETPSNCTWVFRLKLVPVTVIAVFPAPALTAAGVTELKNARLGGFTSVSWICHMLRPCVAARRMREVGRMAKPSTGEFGKPSPITVQFLQGVADSGSGQENTNVSGDVERIVQRTVIVVHND